MGVRTHDRMAQTLSEPLAEAIFVLFYAHGLGTQYLRALVSVWKRAMQHRHHQYICVHTEMRLHCCSFICRSCHNDFFSFLQHIIFFDPVQTWLWYNVREQAAHKCCASRASLRQLRHRPLIFVRTMLSRYV